VAKNGVRLSLITFPAQLRISIHGAGWRESDIDLWISDPAGWRPTSASDCDEI
jgi:prophage regulatory protein